LVAASFSRPPCRLLPGGVPGFLGPILRGLVEGSLGLVHQRVHQADRLFVLVLG